MLHTLDGNLEFVIWWFIVIANKGMAIHLVQLIMVSLPGICQFTFSFGSLLRSKDHNQLENSNLCTGHVVRKRKREVVNLQLRLKVI